MKNIFYKFLIIIGIVTISSCEFDQLENPNAVTLASTDINLLLNKIQRDFGSFFNTTHYNGAAVTRMYHNDGDSYEIAYPATDLNGPWNAYSGLLQDIKVAKELADASKFRRHGGIAKTLEAYALMALVDNFGDVPYSKALDPNDFNPPRDKGSDVYNAALALLVSAQADFVDANSVGTPNDFYFAANFTKWAKVNNAFQLKYWLNKRLTDKAGATSAINALIAKNAFPAVGDEFIWKYSTSLTDPNTRHPQYAPNGGGDYMSNQYMWYVTESKGFDDPRAPYYFYRQVVVNPTNASDIRCVGEPVGPAHYPLDMVYCLPGKRGYWGRDHLDPQGTPPDGLKKTLYGIYPAGGVLDEGKGGGVGAALPGSTGAGLEPIMLPGFVDFMLAEAALELGTTGDAKTLLKNGVTKSLNYVRAFAVASDQVAKVRALTADAAYATSVTRYVDKVDANYTAAATNKDKLRVIALEYYISLFGNGMEAYNLYRRTGLPDNMQLGQVPNFGKFPRTFLYPANHVERNNQAPQKSANTEKVFWDNNPDGFIN